MNTADDPGYVSGPAGAADDTDAVAATGDVASSGCPGTSAAAVSSVGTNSGALVFDDPLDRPSVDDTDRGWGEPSSGAADDDFTRFLNEKPPHHL